MENYHKLLEYFFSTDEDMDKARLPEHMKERLMRLRSVYTYWMNNPTRSQKEIAAEMREKYGLTQLTTYNDLAVIKAALGEFNQCTKDYLRWVFLQRCEEGFKRARDSNDTAAFSKVLATFGKYCKLDKDDDNTPDYSVISPEPVEISANPEDAGYKRIPDLEKKTRELLQKFAFSTQDGETVSTEADTEEYEAPDEE